jgi:hypothetical protein
MLELHDELGNRWSTLSKKMPESTPSFIQIGKRHQESLFFSVADVSAVPKQVASQAASQKAVEHQADNSLQDQ